MKILIAEDDSVTRLRLRTMLEKLGHEVLEAEDGRQALEIRQRERVRVVVLDWMMPKLDGLEFCRSIRAANESPYTYIIMLTVLQGRGRYLEGMHAGADDFVTKPVGPDELAARLRVAERVLGLQADVRQLEGLLHICSYCRKIREGDGTWTNLETYIAKNTDTLLSHSVCLECFHSEVAPTLEQFEARRGNREDTSGGATGEERRVEPGPPIDLADLRRETHEADLEDLVDELLDTFVQDAPRQLQSLETAIHAGDAVATRQAAHRYRSAACTIRAGRLATLLLHVEAAAQEGAVSIVPPDLMPRVRREHEAALAQCQEALGPLHDS